MSLFNHKPKVDPNEPDVPLAAGINLPEDQRAQLAHEVSLLEQKGGARSSKLQADAEKAVLSAVADSVKKLRVVELGRCPACGAHIYQHLGANICDACGWHQYDLPKHGSVKVHIKGDEKPVEGERAYVLKSGDCLVIRHGVVQAQIPHDAYNWVEYVWPEDELDQRQKEVGQGMAIPCGWCGKATNPTQDGFHLLHIAFGASQDRYCFCSDDCYEAFRKMYPSRVHRNCYERDCASCNLCQKRYDDDATEMRLLAKDYLRVKKG